MEKWKNKTKKNPLRLVIEFRDEHTMSKWQCYDAKSMDEKRKTKSMSNVKAFPSECLAKLWPALVIEISNM